MHVGYSQKSRLWSNSWLSKIAGRAKCQKHLPTTKLPAEYMTQSATHHWLSIHCWTCELRSDKNSYRLPCSVDHSWRRTIECLFVTACSMDQYAKEKRTEIKHLIVHSGISKAETTNNKTLRSTLCIEAIQTRSQRTYRLRQVRRLYVLWRSIARPLCDSRASCYLYPCPVFCTSCFPSCAEYISFALHEYYNCMDFDELH